MKSLPVVQMMLSILSIILILHTCLLLYDEVFEKYAADKLLLKEHVQEANSRFLLLPSMDLGWTILAWIAFAFTYKIMITPYSFFKQLNIPNPTADSLLGNLRQLAVTGFNEFILQNIKEFGNIFGIYIGRRPVLCIADPEILKQILVKDFDKFTNRSKIINHMRKPMDEGLLVARDNAWKKIRAATSPTFTSGKLKQTVPLICECIKSLEDNFQKAVTENKSIDAWLACGKFTSDVIISAAFGKSPDERSREEMEVFNRKMEEVFGFKTFIGIVDMLNLPDWLRNIIFNLVGSHDVTYFLNKLRPVINERRNGKLKVGKDFLDLILNENEAGVTELTDTEIMAQSITFLLAGYESSMNGLAFTVYLLALHPDIQEKLYNEIKNQNLDTSAEEFYGNVQKLEYLDQVFSEALRCYPPGYFVMREAGEDYVYNGIKIPKGMEIIIPIYAIQHNPDFWEDPYIFDPERFNQERRTSIKPCTYLPFGYGSRNCIGLRFAQLEAKIALIHLVKRFKFEKSVDTEVPLSVRLGLTMSALHGIYLKVSARK